jgi:hypothetical protein
MGRCLYPIEISITQTDQASLAATMTAMPEWFDHQGFDHQGFDHQGFDHQGFDHQGFDHQGFDHQGFDHQGFDHQGFELAIFRYIFTASGILFQVHFRTEAEARALVVQDRVSSAEG